MDGPAGATDEPDLEALFGAESTIAPARPDLQQQSLFGHVKPLPPPRLVIAAPDMDELFGEDPAPDHTAPVVPGRIGAGQVHPALLCAVDCLVDVTLAGAVEELTGEQDDSDASEDGGQSEEAAAAELAAGRLGAAVQSASEAVVEGDYNACAASASRARSLGLAILARGQLWPRECERLAYLLAEILLALSAVASGDAAAVLMHADMAFLFAPPGEFRNTALLFAKLHGESARALRPPMPEDISRASFPALAPRLPGDAAAAAATVGAVVVQRVPSSTPAAGVADLAREQSPFVIEGAGDDWPALELWASMAHLHRAAGHRTVAVRRGGALEDAGSEWHAETMLLSDFMAEHLGPSCLQHAASSAPLLRATGRKVRGASAAEERRPLKADDGLLLVERALMEDHQLLDQCSSLRGDVQLTPGWQTTLGKPEQTTVWLGTASAAGSCRWSSQYLVLVQVQGIRRAVLLPPEAAASLRAPGIEDRAAEHRGGAVSAIDIHDAEARHTLVLERASARAIDLRPGDLLFVPRGWWYQLRALTPGCSVSFWF